MPVSSEVELNNMVSDYIHLALILVLMGYVVVALPQEFDYSPNQNARTFAIHPTTYTFLKDGKPFQYISGSIHYFRIPKIYWRDRLQKAKAAGLDAVEMYVAWNYHEWEFGEYNFADERDVEHFLELIAKLNLLAIVRVGPYICAEWCFGGLPPWLLRQNPLVRIRSSDPDYFTYVTKWFDVLLPKLRRFLYTNGGPIIMVQLENEYGSSTICDTDYMSMLYDLARYHLGQEIILFTTDGNSESLLRCGSPDQRYLATVDFGPSSNSPNDSFSSVDRFRPKQPLVNSEFYVGWFDRWSDQHFHSKTDSIIDSLRKLMTYSGRVNVNMYMFHGGTTFGFWNGNPSDGPVVTSYDYDAPISEAGDMTEKYMALRKMIHELKKCEPPPLPKNTTKFAYGQVIMKRTNHMMANMVAGNVTTYPVNMEAFRQYDGFLVYSTALPETVDNMLTVTFERFADIAHIYTSDEQITDLYWHTDLCGPYAQTTLNMSSKAGHTRLLLLLENTGYVNYGANMWNDVKGVTRNVTFGGTPLSPWTIMFVQDVPGALSSFQVQSAWPIPGSIYTGDLVIQHETGIYDTFIQPDAFGRGVIYINGHNLGRFNQKLGPQLRLFIPKSFLHQGLNHIIVIELETVYPGDTVVTFTAEPLLNP